MSRVKSRRETAWNAYLENEIGALKYGAQIRQGSFKSANS
jgi:hypothetical protein